MATRSLTYISTAPICSVSELMEKLRKSEEEVRAVVRTGCGDVTS